MVMSASISSPTGRQGGVWVAHISSSTPHPACFLWLKLIILK